MTDPAARAELVAANAAFYAAFESLDVERMAAVWVGDASARCVHPGWRMLEGWPAIRESWARLFGNARSMQFVVTHVEAWVEGALGWVTCEENIIQVTGGEPHYGTVYATNIFRREGEGWRMVVHHASPIATGV